MKFLIVLATVCCVYAVSTVHKRVKRQDIDDNYFAFRFPNDAASVLGVEPRSSGFECRGRQYGYYADREYNCQVFHICLPYLHPDGETEGTRMFSFLCGEGTIFDQAQLVCNYPEFSLECSDAERLYNINDYFGRQDREFRDGLNDIF